MQAHSRFGWAELWIAVGWIALLKQGDGLKSTKIDKNVWNSEDGV